MSTSLIRIVEALEFTNLLFAVSVERVKVLVDQVFPELNFPPGEIVNFSTTEVLAVLDPVWIDQVVPLLLRLGGFTFVILKQIEIRILTFQLKDLVAIMAYDRKLNCTTRDKKDPPSSRSSLNYLNYIPLIGKQ